MSPDRRARELQKQIAKEAFKGRRKTDPPPVNFPSPRRWWESWIFRTAFLIALVWVCWALTGCGERKLPPAVFHRCSVEDGHVISRADESGNLSRAISYQGIYWEIASSSRPYTGILYREGTSWTWIKDETE